MSRMTIIAFGTRGDVQPAVALGRALHAAGHTVRLLASRNFAPWIREQGLEPVPTDVDIQAIMASEGGRDWVEKGFNPVVQLRLMRKLLLTHGMQLATEAWEACRGSDVVISSFTSDVYAVAIAEKLGAKHVSMPLQPTLFSTRDGRALMNAPFPNHRSIVNYWFGRLIIEPAAWNLYGDITNQFRQEVLGLPPMTARDNLEARRRMLILHGYSKHVVPHPADWPNNFHTVGYWFLDRPDAWRPPAALAAFLEAGDPPIAIGFGSMTGRGEDKMTEMIIDAVGQVGCRTVLLAGWAGMGRGKLPESIFGIGAVPHDWLFPRMAAVVHHGGAGSTAAGFRAGVPSVLVPHFADQPFWGQRVHALGVGPKAIPRPRLTTAKLARAIERAWTDRDIRRRAGELGRRIRAEDGVATAVAHIQEFLRS